MTDQKIIIPRTMNDLPITNPLLDDINFIENLYLPTIHKPSLIMKLYESHPENENFSEKTIKGYKEIVSHLFESGDSPRGADFGFSILSPRNLMISVWDKEEPSKLNITKYSWLIDISNISRQDIQKINHFNRTELEIIGWESDIWFAHIDSGEALHRAGYKYHHFFKLKPNQS